MELTVKFFEEIYSKRWDGVTSLSVLWAIRHQTTRFTTTRPANSSREIIHTYGQQPVSERVCEFRCSIFFFLFTWGSIKNLEKYLCNAYEGFSFHKDKNAYSYTKNHFYFLSDFNFLLYYKNKVLDLVLQILKIFHIQKYNTISLSLSCH